MIIFYLKEANARELRSKNQILTNEVAELEESNAKLWIKANSIEVCVPLANVVVTIE